MRKGTGSACLECGRSNGRAGRNGGRYKLSKYEGSVVTSLWTNSFFLSVEGTVRTLLKQNDYLGQRNYDEEREQCRPHANLHAPFKTVSKVLGIKRDTSIRAPVWLPRRAISERLPSSRARIVNKFEHTLSTIMPPKNGKAILGNAACGCNSGGSTETFVGACTNKAKYRA